jgi:hypothetical protein
MSVFGTLKSKPARRKVSFGKERYSVDKITKVEVSSRMQSVTGIQKRR